MSLFTDFNENGAQGLRLMAPKKAPNFQETLQHVWGSYGLAYNCYSYALDIPDHGFGTPGRLTNHPYDRDNGEPTPGKILRGLMWDDLIQIQKHSADPKLDHIIAAIYTDSDSYADSHAFRLDDDGTWSNKPGREKMPSKDFRGKEIGDPETLSETWKDVQFLGYWLVPKTGIKYWQEFYWDPDKLALEMAVTHLAMPAVRPAIP